MAQLFTHVVGAVLIECLERPKKNAEDAETQTSQGIAHTPRSVVELVDNIDSTLRKVSLARKTGSVNTPCG